MIPYEELDRALARWKAKAHGGMADGAVEVAPSEVDSAEVQSAEVEAESVADGEALDAAPSGGTPVVVDDIGSVPEPVTSERTGEIDVAELETYDD